jgi:hypothetical protein
MVGREEDGVWITLKEEIHASPEEVASCIANANGLCRWLAVGAEYPEEAGGTLELAWDREWNRTTEVKVLDHDCEELAEGRARVKWEWFPSPLDDTPVPIEIAVSPPLSRRGDTGGARVIVRHGPFRDNPETLLTVADSAESWRWYLCNLRSVLETKHDMRAVRPL